MKIIHHYSVLIFFAIACSGCITGGTALSFSNDSDSITIRGEPTTRWQNKDGSTTLEFATQPLGTTCLMIHLSADGTLISHWDALSLTNRARIEPGMDQETVRRLLGAYRSVQYFQFSGEKVWDWNVENDGPGYATRFNVHFMNNKVVRTSQTYEFGRDDALFAPWRIAFTPTFFLQSTL